VTFGCLIIFFSWRYIKEKKKRVIICQKKYAKNVLKKFKMYGRNLVKTPLVVNEKLKKDDGEKKVTATLYRSSIRNLLYLIATKPNIMLSHCNKT
jgi:hypothetical protein